MNNNLDSWFDNPTTYDLLFNNYPETSFSQDKDRSIEVVDHYLTTFVTLLTSNPFYVEKYFTRSKEKFLQRINNGGMYNFVSFIKSIPDEVWTNYNTLFRTHEDIKGTLQKLAEEIQVHLAQAPQDPDLLRNDIIELENFYKIIMSSRINKA